MYHKETIQRLAAFVSGWDGIGDKAALAQQVQEAFGLTKKGSVFCGEGFAIRFSSAARGFSNTVLALAKLQIYDAEPFLVCLVTPFKNHLMLANTTFLSKISHSSHTLRVDNIRGSFNGSDILRTINGVANTPDNFEALFAIHAQRSFAENLERLVVATHDIAPTGCKFVPTEAQTRCIRESVERAVCFFSSDACRTLEADLQERAESVAAEIRLAASIDNVNIRGRVIEFLITAGDEERSRLIRQLRANKPLPKIYTADGLGDYERTIQKYRTATDIKTKIMSLGSAPKGYNLDKVLAFLSEAHSVYLIFVVAIDGDGAIHTRLCSMFHRQLLQGMQINKHWAGRNGRGVTQYAGKSLEQIVREFDNTIDKEAADAFLTQCLNAQ